MTNSERMLNSFLNDPDVLKRLSTLYQRTVQQVVTAMASGVSRAGAAQVRDLIRQIDTILARIDPRKQSALREWVLRNSNDAFVMGDDVATEALRNDLNRYGEAKQTAFGPILTGHTVVSNAAMNAVTRMTMEALGKAKDEMSTFLRTTIRRTQVTMLQSERIMEATTGGYLRGLDGQRIRDDIASALLHDKIPAAVRDRLANEGFSADLFNRFERVARGEWIKVGSKTFRVSDYAELVARTQIKEIAKVACISRAKQNGIDHVKMTWHLMPEPDSCSPFAGRVFYVGPLEEDPLGFPPFAGLPSNGDFHPNCRHSFTPWPVMLKTDEEIAVALADVKKIPESLFWKTSGEVDKILRAMGPAGVAAISRKAA